MKNKSLAVQIWLVFTGFMVAIALLVALLVPFIVRPFLTQEIYTRIEDAQHFLWMRNMEGISPGKQEPLKNIRVVKHIFLLEYKMVLLSPLDLPDNFLQEVKEQASQQENRSQRYVEEINGEKVFYVIRKGEVSGQNVYLLSYVWEEYENRIITSLFQQLLSVLVFVLFISFPFSFWLAKYLSRPLIEIEKHVKRIADREWFEPLLLDRKDEIGKLAQSIERMRRRLIQQDESQRSFLQHVSHELKTPVMVIRSYTQAVQDGIYPKGDLNSTMNVIEGEAERLEKQIKNLLYLTKLDYLSDHEQTLQSVDLSELVYEVVDRLRWRRVELELDIDLTSIVVQGNQEQLQVALENLLDNQIRYASTKISISSPEENKLRIWNDGEGISEHQIAVIFDPFHKGDKGQFGLGLAIVSRIAALHQAKVWAENEENGVAFYLQFFRS
jgi:two-component system sensor histidine kinase CssS